MAITYGIRMLMGARARDLGCVTVKLLRKTPFGSSTSVWLFLVGFACVCCLINFKTAGMLVGFAGFSGRGGWGVRVICFIHHSTI